MGDVSINTPTETNSRGDTASAVYVQDQISRLLDVPFLKERTTTTLAATAITGDTDIVLTAGHGAIVGDILEIAEAETENFIQTKVLGVAVNTISIDQPINRTYEIGSTVILATSDMRVSASIASPQIFSIVPLPTQKGDMVKIILSITSTDPQDFEKFGSMPSLANGCVLRVKRQDGTFENIFNWKNNGDFIERASEREFFINTGNSVRAFFASRTFGGQHYNGVIIRIEGSRNEELQVVLQDDLLTTTTNTSFRMYAQGHAIQG